jgi:hypothetical protein
MCTFKKKLNDFTITFRLFWFSFKRKKCISFENEVPIFDYQNRIKANRVCSSKLLRPYHDKIMPFFVRPFLTNLLRL